LDIGVVNSIIHTIFAILLTSSHEDHILNIKLSYEEC